MSIKIGYLIVLLYKDTGLDLLLCSSWANSASACEISADFSSSAVDPTPGTGLWPTHQRMRTLGIQS